MLGTVYGSYRLGRHRSSVMGGITKMHFLKDRLNTLKMCIVDDEAVNRLPLFIVMLVIY